MKLLAVAAVSLTVVAVAAAAPGDPKKVIVPAIQAKAKAINVHVADLGPGSWTAKPSNSKSSAPRCSYYNPNQSDLTENGDADSPNFTLPTESYVASSTGIFKTAAQGRTAYGRVVQPALPKCIAELFKGGFPNPASVKIVSSAAIGFPKLGERTNAFRVVADYKASATVTVRIYLDIVTMNRAKVDVVLFYVGIGQAFSGPFEQGVARKVAARMATVH